MKTVQLTILLAGIYAGLAWGNDCIEAVIVSEHCLGWTEGGDEAFRMESKAQMTPQELSDCLRYTSRMKMDNQSRYGEIMTTGRRYMYQWELDAMKKRYGSEGWCK